MTGVQAALLMTRWSMFTSWHQFIRSKFTSKREFVSLDARAEQKEQSHFELAKVGSPVSVEQHTPTKEFDDYDRKTQSPSIWGHTSPTRHDRPYRQHTMSFSGPRPPSAVGQNSRGGRAEDSYARGEINSSPLTPRSPDYSGRNPHDWRGG